MSDRPLLSPERLAALERSGLMDSPPEAVFDALVEVARDLLGGTAALISLVDDSRQFFKAQVGLGEPWASARQTPLSHSFCQHLVNGSAALLVENAREDDRVRDNLAIDALGVIAYAGVPLVDSDAHVLGALCVVDGQPRQWTEKEVRTLCTLAKAVMSEVTLRQTVARLQQEATERKQAEDEQARLAAEVDAAHGRLRALFETAPAFVATSTGPRHVFESVNSRYERLVGRDRSRLLGHPLVEALPEMVAQGFVGLLDTVYRTGQPYLGTEVAVTLERQGREPEEIFVNFVYQPSFDARGEVRGIDTFGFEVTEQVRLRQREEEVKRHAQERASFEQQLIGIVSHDLRNPLSAILLSASSLARNPTLDGRGAQSVLRISSAAQRAHRLVKDLLDFTQARLGKGIPVHPRSLDLADALEGWVEELRSAFPERDVHVHVHGDVHASVDPDRMAQVVGNIMSNALKYSPAGSAVDVRLRGEPTELVLEVHNGGAPIPEAQQARLFQPLERGQGERDMASRSVGLGLFIVKHVVEAHGGSVAVTSTADAGTTVRVRLPR